MLAATRGRRQRPRGTRRGARHRTAADGAVAPRREDSIARGRAVLCGAAGPRLGARHPAFACAGATTPVTARSASGAIAARTAPTRASVAPAHAAFAALPRAARRDHAPRAASVHGRRARLVPVARTPRGLPDGALVRASDEARVDRWRRASIRQRTGVRRRARVGARSGKAGSPAARTSRGRDDERRQAKPEIDLLHHASST
jgi:hypothetical protein